ncbi:inosine/xanthosine triphosphatase [Marivirga harenae]|uniref:inosine/xanthosine triphosphatase n=1 Tax=Marivirga harenae TaxID=2010992 RepID=UPI0026DF12D8|nr:inosine/xanthosine triphosphatase [Marivirga harenae]WKV12102.1 inosine/xanthosine triphosphatase [Marivirga harenae]|tara:strand:- start:214464 stop:214991 length:528 start_codon:yes stop_codon:yes gene_type:complete
MLFKSIVASKNPVKIEATKAAFKKMFPEREIRCEGVSVSSEVRDQPMSQQETLAGAEKRALNAQREIPNADFWIGIEGGIHDDEFGMQAFAWIVVLSKNAASQAQTAVFYLPEPIAKMVREGVELGDADDLYFGRSNSKQKEGAVGILTNGEIDRKTYYEHAMVMALIPFANKIK